MPEEKDTQSARQSEGSRSTFVICIVSTFIAAIIAVAAYLYVFQTDNEELGADLPEIVPQDVAD